MLGTQLFASERQINKLKEQLQDDCEGEAFTHTFEKGEGKKKITDTHNIIFSRVSDIGAHIEKQLLLLSGRSPECYTIGIDKGTLAHVYVCVPQHR